MIGVGIESLVKYQVQRLKTIEQRLKTTGAPYSGLM